ncbi:MAG: AbrB family transcriptional regulator [Betaproteobacteria bacterium]|nr:AbrB family transcriptional regulator [Betaproteobacteria bacterium]
MRNDDRPLRLAFSVLIWLLFIRLPMLVGKDLLELVKTNEDMNQTELARTAGYLRTTKNGKEQVLVKQFYNALLRAQGVSIAVGKAPGKVARYQTTVHRNGVILLGKTYSQRFNLQPGDELEISIEDDAIRLSPKPVQPAVLVAPKV